MAKAILLRLNIPKSKIDIMVKLIELHSSKIKIQKCDAMGYEKQHAIQICQQLENTEAKFKKFYKK